MKAAFVVVLTLAIVALATLRLGFVSWRHHLQRIIREMRSAAAGAPPLGRFFTDQIAQLPLPVRRYFSFALSPGQPLVVAAHAISRGEFRLRPEGGWHSFTATQHYSTSPRAFVWDARIEMAPLVSVQVADRYSDGEGDIHARAAGLIPVVDQHGTPELASGELLRYLAEAVMLPTALLPCSGVHWSAVDDNSSRATLTDHGNTVSAIFHFGLRGEIVRVSAQRHRDVAGVMVLTPWVGQFREYRSIQGMMVPMVGDVAWILGGNVMSYFHGQTTDITFELAA